MIDVKTMKPFPDDSEIMRSVNAVWNTATLQEKQAFHNVCCNNSEDPMDRALANGLAQKIQESCKDN